MLILLIVLQTFNVALYLVLLKLAADSIRQTRRDIEDIKSILMRVTRIGIVERQGHRTAMTLDEQIETIKRLNDS